MKKLIALVLCFALCSVALISCSKSPADEASAALSEVLDALKAGDMDKIVDLGVADADTEEAKMIMAMFKKLEHKVTEATEVDENTVEVKVSITTVDMMKVFEEYIAQGMAKMAEDPEWEDDGALLETIVDGIEETVTNSATVTMIKEDGKWITAEENTELANALLGGLGDALE